MVTALALALSASAYAEIVTPVLKVGQTRTFTQGQLAPGRTVVCAAGSTRVSDHVPLVLAPGARARTWGDGLSLAISALPHDAYTVVCNRLMTSGPGIDPVFRTWRVS